jgi:hypothetical protein
MTAMAAKSSLLAGTFPAVENVKQLIKLCVTETNTSVAVMLMDVK